MLDMNVIYYMSVECVEIYLGVLQTLFCIKEIIAGIILTQKIISVYTKR